MRALSRLFGVLIVDKLIGGGDEIYNIDKGANINRRSLEVGNDEIRFGCLGFRENEKEKIKRCGSGPEMKECRKVGFRVIYT